MTTERHGVVNTLPGPSQNRIHTLEGGGPALTDVLLHGHHGGSEVVSRRNPTMLPTKSLTSSMWITLSLANDNAYNSVPRIII